MGSCPRAEAAALHLVNLPTHCRVTGADVDRLAMALASTPHQMRPGEGIDPAIAPVECDPVPAVSAETGNIKSPRTGV